MTIDSINMYFKEGKIFFVNNLKKLKTDVELILCKLPSPHGEFSVMASSILWFLRGRFFYIFLSQWQLIKFRDLDKKQTNET